MYSFVDLGLLVTIDKIGTNRNICFPAGLVVKNERRAAVTR